MPYVEIDFDDVPTIDLIEELVSRPNASNDELGEIDLDTILAFLGVLKCPEEILAALTAWANQPATTEDRLRTWVNSCKGGE